MKDIKLNWKIGYTEKKEQEPEMFYPAKVPGAAQLDCARGLDLPDYKFADNFKKYLWMEDVYFIYESEFSLDVNSEKSYILTFNGIDYKYEIYINETLLKSGEGMFSKIELDITENILFLNKIRIIIFPIPKISSSASRADASKSVKPAVSYGWDFHPRLVPSGLWDEVTLCELEKDRISDFQVKYTLFEDFSGAETELSFTAQNVGNANVILRDEAGNDVYKQTFPVIKGVNNHKLQIKDPSLWYPRGYGKQPLYTAFVELINSEGKAVYSLNRRFGFRRSRLVMNQGEWEYPSRFPKSQSNYPITLEINGIKIFAKGANWVPPEIYYGTITNERYEKLLDMVLDMNMNILRVWGGGIVNKEFFYNYCDEKGIMIWQEFPLACNFYDDNKDFLNILESESIQIVKRLRTHPSVIMWCGGNELYNGWSRMTNQSHVLRTLDKICAEHDRNNPFIHTSPLSGMGHGHYLNVDEDGEFLTVITNSKNTAYTEFGCPGPSPADVIKKFMPTEEYENISPAGSWLTHHAFDSWQEESWLHPFEAEYFFEGYQSTEDLIEKLSFIQSNSYKAMFEEMRRQWPVCSMAICWCLNEPWPCAANNSIISYPDIPKPAYFNIKEALRSRLASLSFKKQLYYSGDDFSGDLWFINDTLEAIENIKIQTIITIADNNREIIIWNTGKIAANTNVKGASIHFKIPDDFEGIFNIKLNVEDYNDYSSNYNFFVKAKAKCINMNTMNI